MQVNRVDGLLLPTGVVKLPNQAMETDTETGHVSSPQRYAFEWSS